MNRRYRIIIAGALAMSACSDPETSAEKALIAAQADWLNARASLDPEKRASSYGKVIGDVERIGEKFKKTQTGQALAAGRSAGGVSLAALKNEYERLAERAPCYAKPSIACLEPFASSGYAYQSSAAGSAENAAQTAGRLVCEKKFADADAALEDLKINRPAYAATLVQVALAANECDKPDEVVAAVKAWLAAEPSTGSNRVGALMGLANEEALRAAWPIILPELEKAAAALPENQAAGVELTLASRYASIGEAETALRKFRRVTDELGYSVDVNSRLATASALVAGGFPDEGLSLVDGQPNAENLRIGVLQAATQEQGGRLGVVRAEGAPSANVPYDGDLTEFFAPVAADVRKKEMPIANAIEAKLDEFVAESEPNGYYLGMSGADAALARLALIYQKLGDKAKASALVAKTEAARRSMSPPGAYDANAPSYAGEFEVLVAIGQGDPKRAADLLPRVTPTGNNIIGVVLKSLAAAGAAEEALTLAAETNNAGGNTYQMLIETLGENGHVKEAERVLKAFPGDGQTRSALAWALVERAAAAGKMKEAEKIAAEHSLQTVPLYQLRLVEFKADAAIAGKDRGKAEAAIREMFAMGEGFDERAAAERSDGYFAQNAARKAFSAGYADLGVELYDAAAVKDQRPFFDAFSASTKRSDYPKILMTAHDNLNGDQLSYVVDAAIRGLQVE